MLYYKYIVFINRILSTDFLLYVPYEVMRYQRAHYISENLVETQKVLSWLS